MKKLPDVKLSNKLLNLLEDLLLEGDLLETNMDECHQIWKLLQVKTFCVISRKISCFILTLSLANLRNFLKENSIHEICWGENRNFMC